MDYLSVDAKTLVDDNCFSTPVACGFMRRATGCWHVIFHDIPNVAFGATFDTLCGDAVLDDYGVLVMVGDDLGSVVLS